MRLTIAYSKIKKRNLVLINNDTHQRETLSERPIRLPLTCLNLMQSSKGTLNSPSSKVVSFDAISTSNLEVYKFWDW